MTVTTQYRQGFISYIQLYTNMTDSGEGKG